MSNFEMLSTQWPLLAKLGREAEQYVHRDPSVSLIKIRLLGEQMTEAVFSLERLTPWNLNNQFDKLRELERKGVLDTEIATILHTIRKMGNKAAHNNYGSTSEAMALLQSAHYLSTWFMEVYDPFNFSPTPFAEPKDQAKANFEELAKLREQVELAESEKKAFQEQLEKMVVQPTTQTEQEITLDRRARSKKFLYNANLNEKQTRIMFIDEQLRTVGWEVDTENLDWRKGTRPQKNKNIAIAEFPTAEGRADYALFIGLKLVGIIEAKKYGKTAAGDLSQAKEYSKETKSSAEYIFDETKNGYKAPFLYSSNGRPYLKQLAEQSGIWFWDARTPEKPSYALESWHSPADLLQKLVVNEEIAERELKVEPYPEFANRYYQIDAVKAVEKGLEENKRRMLLAMATGTGKTRLALSLMYRLIKTKRVRRILFLVDRRSLGIQASDALKDTKIDNISFSDIYDVKEVGDILPEQDTKIQIATVQGMVRRLFYRDDITEIPSVGTYDFIIVDEAHRGYTEDREMTEDELFYQNEKDYISQYRRVIDYFDATVVGLTATPALHTTEIFGAPIYTYSYTDAVVDGYLVDHEPPIMFETQLSKHGIKFEANSDVEIWNDETKTIDKAHLEDELDFDVEQFNKKVITENFNKAILEGLTGYIDPNEPGKTLIFAANDQHADLIVRLLKEAYANDGVIVEDDAIEKITGYIRHPDKEIKRFKNEKYPNIVVTVDLLTTGIDVPEIENLVFMRRVKSRILYDQMLGRATRLCAEIGKDAFKIFDAVHLYDYLQNITDMKPVVSNPKQTIQKVLEKALLAEDNEEFGFFKAELIAKLQRKKQRISKKDKDEIVMLNKTANLDLWIQSIKTMSRSELELQTENINRVASWFTFKDPTIISVHKDTLIDISRGYGEENVKPADYLNEFNKFIRENINLIPALQVIVKRPKDLTYQDLREVQLRLKEKKFDETSLREAWRQDKKEYIAADIISFIRMAALGTTLVDHETRIKRAMQKVYGMDSWNPKQLKWLQRIEKQLLETPVLAPTAKQYFDETEVWKQQGGYKFLLKQIGDNVDNVVQVLNQELYVA
ncbi:type I restriction-modification system endonuclease [Enterococcus dispar]|mgnify:CR=1 FL=1|uniref:type I restriction-modification system endonuclease n=1 Tax=Enterococcus dispar TaxID=44009 RepID=UPI002491C8D0|nr:type I restriction-modification system endonuclease [Enterococcus dispar]